MIQIWLGVVSSRLQSDEEYMDHLLIDDSPDNKKSVHQALVSYARSSHEAFVSQVSVSSPSQSRLPSKYTRTTTLECRARNR